MVIWVNVDSLQPIRVCAHGKNKPQLMTSVLYTSELQRPMFSVLTVQTYEALASKYGASVNITFNLAFGGLASLEGAFGLMRMLLSNESVSTKNALARTPHSNPAETLNSRFSIIGKMIPPVEEPMQRNQ